MTLQSESEFEERGRLIEQLLDVIYPFHPDMSDDVREGVEADRQMLAIRAGWDSMPIEELRRKRWQGTR
jgi:hypothetical protein